MMKRITTVLSLITASILICSCGKKSENSDPGSSSTVTTPELRSEDGLDSEASNNQFTLTLDKTEFALGEVILLDVKNIGKDRLNHLGFEFVADPSDITATKLNCFEFIGSDESCTFSIVFKNPISGYQKIIARYNDNGFIDEVEMRIKLVERDDNSGGDGNNTDPLVFLYNDEHTKTDCIQTAQLGDLGFMIRLGAANFCEFRGRHHNTAEDTQIEQNPLDVFINHSQDPNEFYCPTGWTLDSFKFAQTKVVEKTNFFGGKRDVIIPPGESREVCIKRKFFGGCKESKVFYSRLTSVTCY